VLSAERRKCFNVTHKGLFLFQGRPQNFVFFEFYPQKVVFQKAVFCFKVTHRNFKSYSVTHKKVFLFECCPQKSVLLLQYPQKTVIVWVYPQESVSLKKYTQNSGKGLGLPVCEIQPCLLHLEEPYVTGKNFEAVLRTPPVGQVESGHKSIPHNFSKWQQQVSP